MKTNKDAELHKLLKESIRKTWKKRINPFDKEGIARYPAQLSWVEKVKIDGDNKIFAVTVREMKKSVFSNFKFVKEARKKKGLKL